MIYTIEKLLSKSKPQLRKFEDNGITLYLEAKTRGKKVYCRIGKIISDHEEVVVKQPIKNDNKVKEISLLLENTTNSQEIADFLRLGVALNCKVFFKTNIYVPHRCGYS